MKSALTLLWSLLLLASTCNSHAEGNTLRGALVGGALGALIGENSSDIRTENAVAALAGIGALVGYAKDNSSSSYAYGPDYCDRHYPYSRYGSSYYRNFDGGGRSIHGTYPHWQQNTPHYRHVSTARAPAPVQTAPRQVAPPAPETNLHPGVTIVRVPVQWPNGIIRYVRILRINDRYVGPQGEDYDSLPDAAALAARYVPSS